MTGISIPNRQAVETIIKSVFNHLFPEANRFTASEIILNQSDLQYQIINVIAGLTEGEAEIAGNFFEQLTVIKKTLEKDATFILESDPAATQLIEIVAIYPGFLAIYCYRIANSFARQGVPLFPRMITEYAHKVTGIDIHPLASIGSPFSIDHGTGIVIGETTAIGNNVKLYQGVTLGALSVDKSKASKKRHPTIEDNVVLYSGCTILGGGTVVGANSIIGGNVWLTESIAPNSVVYHKPEIVVRSQDKLQDQINFII